MYHSCDAINHDCVGAATIVVTKPKIVWYLQVLKEAHTFVVPPNNWSVGDRLESC